MINLRVCVGVVIFGDGDEWSGQFVSRTRSLLYVLDGVHAQLGVQSLEYHVVAELGVLLRRGGAHADGATNLGRVGEVAADLGDEVGAVRLDQLLAVTGQPGLTSSHHHSTGSA